MEIRNKILSNFLYFFNNFLYIRGQLSNMYSGPCIVLCGESILNRLGSFRQFILMLLSCSRDSFLLFASSLLMCLGSNNLHRSLLSHSLCFLAASFTKLNEHLVDIALIGVLDDSPWSRFAQSPLANAAFVHSPD